MNKIENRKTHENASMLWNSDGEFKDDSDDVDVDNNDDIVDIKDIINTTGKLKFFINYYLFSVLSTRSMTWCFVDDVDEDENCVNFTFMAILTSFIFL